jgi:hypothetical protein
MKNGQIDLTTMLDIALTMVKGIETRSGYADRCEVARIISECKVKASALDSPKSNRLTQEQIESLPKFARDWIYDLETRCDPAGELAELRLMQDTVKAQQVLIEELKAAQKK